MTLLQQMCNFVVVDNIVGKNWSELQQITGLSDKQLQRAKAELKTEGDVVVDTQGNIRVNPWYAWCGDWIIRAGARVGWSKGKFEPTLTDDYISYDGQVVSGGKLQR